MNLQGKKILLGISASIAAYKSIHLVRLLIKAGAEVKVVLTPAAETFVSPLVLSTLSKNTVISGFANSSNDWSNHVMLGRWADLMVVAPASCNTIAKMAHGLCDNMLMATYLSATMPVMIAPAMDEDMWKHPTTQRNLAQLQTDGVQIIPVASGELASGLTGEGRMAEPETIVQAIIAHLTVNENAQPLRGKKVLVTAGPTYEAIDPVRFIGNHSSGKMGIAITEALLKAGATVHLVLGPSTQAIPQNTQLTVRRVVSAQDMYEACNRVFADVDIAILSAAVADFTPANVANEKIKKDQAALSVTLQPTIDILKTLGAAKTNQFLVGFALETNNEEANALKKLASKNADAIVLNSLNDAGAGFGTDTNQVQIFTRKGEKIALPLQSKSDIAHHLVQFIAQAIAL
ncbi:MAG TPA: bifunctional phosphopantothenoylcysteine decarboxylase/phosphopantothenate--cysteine ligase CoaBC [Chitinophagaceae bacterium]|nr:bifunctional phosphopantothenoylcysteine decarboxylase/phosphopantothenate--cysteine ligase CoaBC [Chitinophagaceae bacterium]